MRALTWLSACTLIGCASAPVSYIAPRPAALRAARQLILVRADSWSSTSGELRRYQRGPDGEWAQVSGAVPAVLGRNGLGWGRGLHGEPPGAPVKREGDGRAPAGVFDVGPAFGSAPVPPPGTQVNYIAATDTLECVDDPASPHYNGLWDTSLVPRDWRSSEKMLRQDGLYDLGLFIHHNRAPPRRGAGSCIFLHVWKGPAQPTAGCTAIAKEELIEVIRWLDPAALPVFVQLPAPELTRRREPWGLPGF
jgi:L,D-peptidoglycan transpeptidase YkuD (ErfK/YbiS/YcfS/YnhG family)